MKKRFLFIAIALIAVACARQNDFEKELDAVFAAHFQSGLDEPGASILIAKNNTIIYSKNFGLADLNTKEAITNETVFNTGSVSKTFVANTILMLARENKLSLNDSLSKYFPGFKNPSIGQTVKIIHLLTHTSGLPDNRRKHLSDTFLLTANDQENFDPILLNDSLLFEPGSRFQYSNPAFNALALIIEKVTGRKWQEVVKEKIFVPAGMNASTITDYAHPEKGVAHAYLKTDSGFTELDYGEEPTFNASGNGGVWSSTKDLLHYEKALQQSLFLTTGELERSRTITRFPNWSDTTDAFIGISWFISKESDSTKIVSHTGSQGGFSCDYLVIPEKGLQYIILCNVPRPIHKIRMPVLELLKKYHWK